MAGIVSCGVYIPYHYVDRNEIAKIWGKGRGTGEKAVANFDEDSVTMSVAAGRDCLGEIDPLDIDRVYFASTTAPYFEKQSASIVATALDLRQDVFCADFCGSLRAGTDAFRAALDAVQCGSARNILVCAADTRLGLPQGEKESSLGDGAGAILVSESNVVATVLHVESVQNEILDVWRSDQDRFIRSWEGRFVRDEAYGKTVVGIVSRALKKVGLAPSDFAKAVISAPHAEYLNYAARRLDFDLKTQVESRLYVHTGDTGAALPFMLLGFGLEGTRPKDKILLVSYGDGCNLFILEMTEGWGAGKSHGTLDRYLTSRKRIGYEKYLRWREILPTEAPPRPPADQSRPSAVALWRDRKGGLALYGVKCRKCGTAQYPAQRVCFKCGSKDDFEDYPFAHQKARLTTFSHDMLSPSIDPPTTVCAVDFDGGGRIMCDMTDRDPEQIRVGMGVEMTFRRLFYRADFYTYWWKCQPPRK